MVLYILIGTKRADADAARSDRGWYTTDYADQVKQYNAVSSGHVVPGMLPLGDFKAFVNVLRSAVAPSFL